MNWIATSILVIGLLVWYSRKSPARRKAKPVPPAKPAEAPTASVEELVTSGDEEKMSAALADFSEPLDRHRLLSALITGVYPQRDSAGVRKRLYAYGKIYLSEFDRMAPALQAASDTGEMDVPAFKCLAIAMEEDRGYDAAIEICRRALKWDLDDGTKTGYRGRMERLQKKKDAPA